MLLAFPDRSDRPLKFAETSKREMNTERFYEFETNAALQSVR
jgi:hypothetical protein